MSTTIRADRRCRDCGLTTNHADGCGLMEPKSATRQVQDWQRVGGEKIRPADGWAQRPEYKP